jgi:ribonuclease P protein component
LLSKKYKLPIQDFVGRSGKIVRGSHFFLKIFLSTAEVSRFGIIISKKVSNKATERNRIKRLIFSFFQKKVNQLPINNYLLITMPSLGKLKKEAIINELEEIIKKIK